MSSNRAAPAIWWIRRDLRLADNQALHAALAASPVVVPLFIWDPVLLNSQYTSDRRVAFLRAGLHALDRALSQRGSRLVIRCGRPAEILTSILAESGARSIWAEADVSPFARRRDGMLADQLPLFLEDGLTALPVGSVTKATGEPYSVYTPFSRRWKSLVVTSLGGVLPPPGVLSTPPDLRSEAPPAASARDVLPDFPAGEVEALRRLRTFVEGDDAPVFHYATLRDRPDLDGASQLSPYLRFGMVSLRAAVHAAQAAQQRATSPQAQRGAEVWLNELIWREFYLNILAAFPHVRRRSFRPGYDRIAWRNDAQDFAAWCEGRTGYPFVDAAMRQLRQTGWLHNRARMVVASFLVKDLMIDWRWGEQWFMQQLIDGDPAPNNGGWQWVAGTGTDAAPYFRVFNPIQQSQKFDPDGNWIRRWVPELALVPAAHIHAPWAMARTAQERTNCRIGLDYPAPIVDHAQARHAVLAAYRDAI